MRLWQFLLTLLGLAAVFAVGLLAFNFLVMPRLVHRNQEIRVPTLLDAPLADARESAAAVALVLEVIREEAHPSAPAGTVIDQQPQPGGVIRSGRRIIGHGIEFVLIFYLAGILCPAGIAIKIVIANNYV